MHCTRTNAMHTRGGRSRVEGRNGRVRRAVIPKERNCLHRLQKRSSRNCPQETVLGVPIVSQLRARFALPRPTRHHDRNRHSMTRMASLNVSRGALRSRLRTRSGVKIFHVFPAGVVSVIASSSSEHFARADEPPSSTPAPSPSSSNTMGASMPNFGTKTTMPFARTRMTRASVSAARFGRRYACAIPPTRAAICEFLCRTLMLSATARIASVSRSVSSGFSRPSAALSNLWTTTSAYLRIGR